MKKLIVFLWVMLFAFTAYSAPNTSISVPNSFSPNTTISSSATNANNNEISTKFNTHSHTTDIAGTDITTTGQGAIPYFSATGIVSMLTAGTSGYFLKTNGAGASPSWAIAGDMFYSDTRFNCGNFSQTISSSTDVAITGVGFKPVFVDFTANTSGGVFYGACWGFDDGTSPTCVFTKSTSFENSSNRSIVIANTDNSADLLGSIKTLDSNGFTIQWSKTGSPTGTALINWKAYR